MQVRLFCADHSGGDTVDCELAAPIRLPGSGPARSVRPWRRRRRPFRGRAHPAHARDVDDGAATRPAPASPRWPPGRNAGPPVRFSWRIDSEKRGERSPHRPPERRRRCSRGHRVDRSAPVANATTLACGFGLANIGRCEDAQCGRSLREALSGSLRPQITTSAPASRKRLADPAADTSPTPGDQGHASLRRSMLTLTRDPRDRCTRATISRW